jgi:hypothetical protein
MHAGKDPGGFKSNNEIDDCPPLKHELVSPMLFPIRTS